MQTRCYVISSIMKIIWSREGKTLEIIEFVMLHSIGANRGARLV